MVQFAKPLLGPVRASLDPFEASESFIIPREPYWETQKWSETLSLAEAIDATCGAIDAAFVKRREHANETADDLVRLRRGADLLAAVREELKTRADHLKETPGSSL